MRPYFLSARLKPCRDTRPRLRRLPNVETGTFFSTSGRLVVRQAVDVFCAAIGLILLSPLIAILALAIKLEDGGPVFYSQLRVGKGFSGFRLLKFRSMVPDADRLAPLAARCDARVTRVGKILRRFKLDELPQLFNVVKGDMQLVGARPELERYVQMFRQQYAIILADRPGITDPATVVYRQEERSMPVEDVEKHYVTQILPYKLHLSVEYSRRRTFISDLGIIFRTMLGRDSVPGYSGPPRGLPGTRRNLG